MYSAFSYCFYKEVLGADLPKGIFIKDKIYRHYFRGYDSRGAPQFSTSFKDAVRYPNTDHTFKLRDNLSKKIGTDLLVEALIVSIESADSCKEWERRV